MIRRYIRDRLPQALSRGLWGDRGKWGLVPQQEDRCWREWEKKYVSFYEANQRGKIGTIVNDGGYQIMSHVNVSGKVVLEIGAGDIRHLPFWHGAKPSEYIVADIQDDMAEKARRKLSDAGIPSRSVLVERGASRLPIGDGSVDVIVTFYSLEHIYPLLPYLHDLHRILRAGGIVVGAVPAEGGLAWGLGRALTSRRWLKRNTKIDPDKIICWEHPNFADDILDLLEGVFHKKTVSLWPFPFLPLLDVNLVIRFIYEKK